MNELATDEMQCVMQLLDRVSLLQFARCSRRLLSGADSAVAWKYQSSYGIEFACADVDVGGRIRHSLLRHAPAMSVDWILDEESESFFPTDAEVSALFGVPRMTRLRVSRRLSADLSHRVLSHSALDGLGELTLGDAAELPFGFVDLLICMPSLTSLRIEGNLPYLDPLTALPQLRLRSLTLRVQGSVGWLEPISHTRTVVIAQCAHITDLDIYAPYLYGSRFRLFFTSNCIRQLQRLTIRHFWAHRHPVIGVTLSAEDYVIAFQSLIQLRFLSLQDVYGVQWMLQHLHHAPALQQVEVRPGSELGPSVAVLQQLINRTSSTLHIHLVAPAWSDHCRYATLQEPARFTYRVQ
jgi:hypothetical protein